MKADVARRNALAERYLWLVGEIFAEEFRGRGDPDDLYSEGQYALLRAAGSPCHDDGVGTYLANAIRWAMTTELRRAARRWHRSGDEAYLWPSHLWDPGPSDRARARVARLLARLTERESRVVTLVHGLAGAPTAADDRRPHAGQQPRWTASFAEVGRVLGLTPQRVHQIYRRALERLRLAS